MKIKSIKKLGRLPVYDISVKDVEHYVLENGIVTHNTGSYYSAGNIFIIGRQQEKDKEGLSGYNFVINIEKSRLAKEKSKITVSVDFKKGISKWSGLLDIALESGHVFKPSNGWYQRHDVDGVVEEKKYRLAETNTKAFWEPILNDPTFKQFVEEKYKMANGTLLSEDTVEFLEDSEDDTEE